MANREKLQSKEIKIPSVKIVSGSQVMPESPDPARPTAEEAGAS
jgi:hypothetical protein